QSNRRRAADPVAACEAACHAAARRRGGHGKKGDGLASGRFARDRFLRARATDRSAALFARSRPGGDGNVVAEPAGMTVGRIRCLMLAIIGSQWKILDERRRASASLGL